MLKNVIIIHGCPSKQEDLIDIRKMNAKHWIPWVAAELKDKGIEVHTPLMPNSWAPVYEDWKQEIEKIPVDEETILVGHSCGCAFLVRWLSGSKKKIKKLILVASSKIPKTNASTETRQFYNFEVDSTIKDRVSSIVILIGANEEERVRQSASIYREALGAEIKVIPGKKHFIASDMPTNEFPELLDEILK